ncbi:MAG: septum formation initiator family protein [Alphaproteobacteria bacterium]|nr:septum formation initiator family protein [Alphaproteobacteria bacterium]
MPKLKAIDHLHFYILPCVFLMITLYFTYHLIEGERGISRWFAVNQELVEAGKILSETQKQKEMLEKRVALLSSQHLDADMLEETLHQELGLIEKEEYIIFD